MTTHSISILLEPKMSSFGLYAGVKTCSPSIALSTALCWRRAKCPAVPQTSWTHDWYMHFRTRE